MSAGHDRDGAAAYVLGALEPAEARDFETHLAGCAACRAEVEDLQPVANALAEAAPPARAPRGVRRAVLAEVRREAELMDASGLAADRPPRRRRLARPALAAAATLAAAAAVALGFVLGSGSGGAPTRTTPARVTAAAGTHAGARLETAGAVVSLHVWGFRSPGRGRVYQVWLARPGATAPIATRALFTVDQDGRGVVELPRAARRARQLMVTSERDGGSVTGVPSRAPVLSARL